MTQRSVGTLALVAAAMGLALGLAMLPVGCGTSVTAPGVVADTSPPNGGDDAGDANSVQPWGGEPLSW